MSFLIGDKAYFIGANPKECSSCNQGMADLEYSIVEGLISSIITVEQASWPTKKDIEGQEEELSIVDYTKKPTITEVKHYDVIVGDTILFKLAGNILKHSVAEATELLATGNFIPVVMSKPRDTFTQTLLELQAEEHKKILEAMKEDD